MNMTFMDLLDKLPKLNRFNEDYYNLIEFSNLLEELGSIDISVYEDYLITPFYICNEGICEFYWCELLIQLVDKPSFIDYLLKKTGRKNVNEIDKVIRERTEKLYLEILRPDSTFPSSKLIDYINFIRYYEEIKEDMEFVFKRDGFNCEFDENCLYFTVY